MRMNFSVVVCALLAMAWWAETAPVQEKRDMLYQAIKLIRTLQPTVQETGTLYLHSPTNDIKACCYQSALRCFNSQLSNVTTNKMDQKIKLQKTLRKSSIETSMGVCTKEEQKKAMCKPCDSYIKMDSKDFLKNLLSLLQKSFSQLP